MYAKHHTGTRVSGGPFWRWIDDYAGADLNLTPHTVNSSSRSVDRRVEISISREGFSRAQPAAAHLPSERVCVCLCNYAMCGFFFFCFASVHSPLPKVYKNVQLYTLHMQLPANDRLAGCNVAGRYRDRLNCPIDGTTIQWIMFTVPVFGTPKQTRKSLIRVRQLEAYPLALVQLPAHGQRLAIVIFGTGVV